MKRAFIAAIALLLCVDATAAILRPQKPPAADEATPPERDCDKACAARAQVDRHLLLMGEFDNDRAQQKSLRELAALGPLAVRAVQEAYDDWSRATKPTSDVDARPGEMRWRAVYLLGELGVADARRNLYEIARHGDVAARHGEQAYADDARIKVRAVAGLQQLKAIDELKALHELGGPLSNSTAAALFELGYNVGGVTFTEARVALAADTADSKDNRPGKGRDAQPEKPGSQRFKVKPRGDSPALNRNGG
jgi:hypothetical protein